VEANSTGGQGSRRAVAPSDDDDDNVNYSLLGIIIFLCIFDNTVNGESCISVYFFYIRTCDFCLMTAEYRPIHVLDK
jgi:hypothetical protein